jgi:hypothetical protein
LVAGGAGRSGFAIICDPRLVAAAFVAATQSGVSWADWMEAAIRDRLTAAERAASSAQRAEEVKRFCEVAERDPRQLPAHLQRVYRAVSGFAWDWYWSTPRVSVEQIEHGSLPEGEVAPFLNRQRVLAAWSSLMRSDD